MRESTIYDEQCEVDGVWDDQWGNEHYFSCAQQATHECKEHNTRFCKDHYEEHILEYHPEEETKWTLDTTSESSETRSNCFPE